jgi:hypothetical protein
LPVIAEFEDHDGYSGIVFGLPGSSRQLELVSHAGEAPSPTPEDQLVFYLGSASEAERLAVPLRDAGFVSSETPNPYWSRTGALCFVDPDGYSLLLSPESGSSQPSGS